MTSPINPHPHVKISVIFIDPLKAQQLIEKNTANQRKVKKRNLTKITNCIREGRFVLNGESIVVSDTGRLLNGQHRVLGVINSGCGIWTVFVEGVPDEYFPTFDSGRIRAFSDVLHINGEVSANHLATAAQRLAEYIRDPQSLGCATPFSHAELWATTEAHPGLAESLRACATAGKVISPSRVAWLHFIAAPRLPELTAVFFERLSSGAMLKPNSPILKLIHRLNNDRAKKTKTPIRELLALVIKAWNAHVAGAEVKNLRWSEQEQFPTIQLHKS